MKEDERKRQTTSDGSLEGLKDIHTTHTIAEEDQSQENPANIEMEESHPPR